MTLGSNFSLNSAIRFYCSYFSQADHFFISFSTVALQAGELSHIKRSASTCHGGVCVAFPSRKADCDSWGRDRWAIICNCPTECLGFSQRDRSTSVGPHIRARHARGGRWTAWLLAFASG